MSPHKPRTIAAPPFARFPAKAGRALAGAFALLLAALPLTFGGAPAARALPVDSAEAAEPKTLTGKEELWGAVILGALREDEPRETAEELKEFQDQLHNIFGYDTYRIAGEFTEPLSQKEFEVKTKHFSMQLTHLGSEVRERGEPLVHRFQLKLYQKGNLIVEAEVESPTGTPFYVRGPVWGRKEIILMILVR